MMLNRALGIQTTKLVYFFDQHKRRSKRKLDAQVLLCKQLFSRLIVAALTEWYRKALLSQDT